MRKILIFVFVSLFTACLFAREVYCSVIKEKNGARIIPNQEYLNDFYWDYITKDSLGNEIIFNSPEEAINVLANFGWYVVKTENYEPTRIIMGHNVDSYMDIKSSRDKMINLQRR